MGGHLTSTATVADSAAHRRRFAAGVGPVRERDRSAQEYLDEPSTRDAEAMTAYRITYTGPPSFAVQVATALADADGVELTAQAPAPPDGGDRILLTLSVEGEPDDIADAVTAADASLPPGSMLVYEPVGEG